jgi:hypothetical protein
MVPGSPGVVHTLPSCGQETTDLSNCRYVARRSDHDEKRRLRQRNECLAAAQVALQQRQLYRPGALLRSRHTVDGLAASLGAVDESQVVETLGPPFVDREMMTVIARLDHLTEWPKRLKAVTRLLGGLTLFR